MILLCRHGETQWNIQKRKQGRKDSPLTHNGIKQAIALSKELNNHLSSETILLCSPLFRTRQYASIISDVLEIQYNDIQFIDDLQEHSFGSWEGLNEDEIEKVFPGMVKAREEDWWNYQVPGGESYKLLEKRLTPFVQNLDLSKEYIIIAHEMVSKVLRKIFLNLSEEQCLALKHPHNVVMKIENNKLSELEF